jgi:DNA-binding NarL/FixJ family response regulator
MRFRTLIVDDEPVARSVLREELEQFDEVEIVGEAESGDEALRLIAKMRPA